MKRFTLLFAAAAVTSAAYAQDNGKTLVAYFSATGVTERAAGLVAEVTGGDLYEIKPVAEYTAEDLDWTVETSRSTKEMKDAGSRPEMVLDLKDAESYDTIYIGFPIWWNIPPRIIYTFIEAYGFEGKTVIPFVTSGGSTIANSEKVLSETYPKINWGKGRLLNRATEASVRDWLGK